MTRRWTVALLEGLLGLAQSRLGRVVALSVARTLLVFRRVAPGQLLQRAIVAFVRMEAACCRAESPLFKLIARHLTRLEHTGTLERMRRFLREAPRDRAARRLAAWATTGLLGALKHEVLQRRAGTPGVPPRLLTQAQLALSPGCDLSCEGCYTAEDRGGEAPGREEIAYLVDEAARCGAFAIHVIGKGEPFLSPVWADQLLDVIEERPHLFFTIATHGMRIDDRIAARVGRLGNLVLLIAVDGPEALHDARRGDGSYRRVHATFARLRAHGAHFGFSCMVSEKSHAALTAPEFVRAQSDAGCTVGIYSRYFPLAGGGETELALGTASLSTYRENFERLDASGSIPLFDLDEVERETGCHSRAGESVYIDGITGRVAPCLRVPFAPEDCVVDRKTERRLADALAHPFFEAYRARRGGCPSWCGANLEAEIASVAGLLGAGAGEADRLLAYKTRSALEQSGPRRLPMLTDHTAPQPQERA